MPEKYAIRSKENIFGAYLKEFSKKKNEHFTFS